MDINDLCENPEEHGFNKVISCDKCGSKLYCNPNFDPPSCMTCFPESWGSGLPDLPEEPQ